MKKLKRNRTASPPIYCDTAMFDLTPFGIKLAFGSRRQDDRNEGQEIFDESVVVGMSMEHAAALWEAIGANLDRYQKQCGPIRSLHKVDEHKIEPVENKLIVPN